MRQEFQDHGRRVGHRPDALHGVFGMGRNPFGRGPGRGPRHGGGPGGMGDDGEGRIGRFLLQGDLRLLVLALIEKEPRHGYEIIRHVEEMTQGFYAPSPGVIYPTLSYLEEAGHILAQSDGNKKRYAVTEDGRAYLADHREAADGILERLVEIAERMKQRREHHAARGEEKGPKLPRSVEAALLNLREVAARALEEDDRRSSEITRLLLQMADDLERKEGGSPGA